MQVSGDETRTRKHEEAAARGQRIRDDLLQRLRTDGPQAAADLHPEMDREVSLSEVAFQLNRLAEEGRIAGEVGGVYAPTG